MSKISYSIYKSTQNINAAEPFENFSKFSDARDFLLRSNIIKDFILVEECTDKYDNLLSSLILPPSCYTAS